MKLDKWLYSFVFLLFFLGASLNVLRVKVLGLVGVSMSDSTFDVLSSVVWILFFIALVFSFSYPLLVRYKSFVLKFFSVVADKALVPFAIGVLVLLASPFVWNYYSDSVYKRETYQVFIDAIKHDESEDVKKAAAIVLGNIGDKKSLDTICQQAINYPELSEIKYSFISGKNMEKYLFEASGVVQELYNAKKDKKLSESSLDVKYVKSINSAIDSLRSLRSTLKEGKLTQKEGVKLNAEKMIEKIDTAIEMAEASAESINAAGYGFDSLSTINLQLDKDIDKLLSSEGRNKLDMITAFENVEASAGKLQSRLDEPYEDVKGKTDAYINMVSCLLDSDPKDVLPVVEKLAMDEDVAIDIRARAIDVLGVIGNKSNLEKLIAMSSDESPEIRESAIYSMGLIYSGKQDKKNARNGGYLLSNYNEYEWDD